MGDKAREYIQSLRAEVKAALKRHEQIDFFDALATSRPSGEMAVYWLLPALREAQALRDRFKADSERLEDDLHDARVQINLMFEEASKMRQRANQIARFELRQEENTGRLFWWGAEDGWKDAAEIGEDGVLTLDATAFAVGTVLILTEPEER